MSSREKAMKREFVLQGSLESSLQRPPKSGGLWKGDRMGCLLCELSKPSQKDRGWRLAGNYEISTENVG